MQDVRWLARITTAGPAGPLTGAGILISDREVLTCAHVVHGVTEAEVRLVAHPDRPPLAATVVLRGPWPELPGGAGDVAVLELSEPVPAQTASPAPFAPLHRWAGPPARVSTFVCASRCRRCTQWCLVNSSWMMPCSKSCVMSST